MIIESKNNTLAGKNEKPILTDVFYNDDPTPKSIVIFCHGYKGFKDWGAWDLVAKKFASLGYFFIKFNFSHNGGTTQQPIDFPDLEAFGENNYTKELDDLQSIIDWVTAADFPYKSRITDTITLIGHSRGGGIVTIKAEESSDINQAISWAGVSDYASRFPKGKALRSWEASGISYVENGRTKQKMPHYFQFYTNFMENEKRLTISRAVAALQIPYLILHGTEDPTVPVEEAELLHQWNTNSHLILIPNTDHVFGARHPWSSDTLPAALNTIIAHSDNFIKTNLPKS